MKLSHVALSFVFTSLLSLTGARTATAQGYGACGGVVPAGGGSNDLNHFDCSCSGAGTVLKGGVDLPIGGLSGGYSSGSPLVCTAYVVLAEYDAFTPDGNALVKADHFVYNLLVTPSCDTSDCGKFLGFLWSVGKAQCDYADPVESGGHMSYTAVGNCTPSVEASASTPKYRSPYGLPATPASK